VARVSESEWEREEGEAGGGAWGRDCARKSAEYVRECLVG